MLLSSCLSLSLLLGVVLQGYEATQYAPEVTTKSGKIRGVLANLNTGGTIRKYLGVRFGEAKRFKEPVDPDQWTGVKDTIAFGKICPQLPSAMEKVAGMSEDCLNLNVFVPHGASKSLPVMVWVHGGAFNSGSNKIYDGSYIATLGDVIVVAINYRLNVFGFLATGSDGDLKGNYGMLDQIHALKWVNSPVNLRIFWGPDQTNCNRMFFTVKISREVT
ncbi:hypothetical protein QZH41_000856 [Actinostola sp. cb2023]|nr:hypothetical protein QZH41_000856 [Actinostola sp. cb2023]